MTIIALAVPGTMSHQTFFGVLLGSVSMYGTLGAGCLALGIAE